MMMLVKLVQRVNALFPMLVTLVPIVALVIRPQDLNISFPRLVI